MTVPVLKACRAAVFFVALALTAPALSQTADELSTQGRAAASRNENAEAARLFGEAIRVDPAQRPALLREYADQLAFSGRPADAVLLYRERLAATDLDAAARAALERGLALALLWSGAFDEAAPTLEALSNAAPTDTELRRAFVDAVVGSARAAAGRGANKEAVERFERALAIDPARRPDIAREFADQLAFSGEPARAVPVYREVASRADLPDEERRRTTRSLAFALLWSGAFREAIPAWEAILRENAGDDEARRGLADALVGSARREAEAGRNAGAVTSFRRALDTAPGRRRELLAELADQVAYAGRPGDAVPLYREGLRQTDRPAEELARLRRGLAFALLWSGSFAEASRALEEVLAAAPDDAEVRKALADAREKRATPVAPRRPEAPSAVARPSPAQGSPSGPAAAPAASPAPPQTETDRAIAAARAAAGRGANKEAVEGFERALAITPGRRPEIAREYADQLAFSGQPARAVPLYREVLARENLPADERRRAARALAFALLWSSQFDDAIPAWERILSGLPGDAEARRALADAHVGAARKAAETRRNAAAVRQFEAAIRVEPSRRRELLPELADQVAYAGRPSDAVPLYREGLAQAGRTPAERARLGRGLAFALLWSNQFREAAAAWRAILAANPRDGEARKALSDALVGAARASAGARRHADAAGLFREAIGLQPGRRGELLREYAEQVLYAGRAAEAT
ncbi:MAG TPA: tetratricopeptide repeat protein, partial [Salinarimonas sp.]|nr:tetratricopeptide repeat protein [Salinarimonas sp.]